VLVCAKSYLLKKKKRHKYRDGVHKHILKLQRGRSTTGTKKNTKTDEIKKKNTE